LPRRFYSIKDLFHEALHRCDNIGQSISDNSADRFCKIACKAVDSIADNTCVLVDTVRKSLHEVRHPALKICERSLIWYREVQEGLDLIRYALDRIGNLIDTALDAIHNSVDDIRAPLKCL